MAKGDNSPAVSALAGTFQQLARQEFEAPPMLDFGVIQDDFSLLTNTYPVSIPPSDYLVCRTAALPNEEIIVSEETTAKNKSHTHKADDGDMMEQDMSPMPVNDVVKLKAVTVKQEPHDHDVDIARPTQRHLQPGDRVLVAWVDNDAVVIDIIYTATRLREMTDDGV